MSDSDNEPSKSVRIIQFSGDQDDWNRWSKQFLAAATTRGYREVLKPSDPTKKADATQNTHAYSELLLASSEDVCFGIVKESVSNDFPDGDARLAWKNL